METINLKINPKANKEAELLVYGYIGGWDVQSRDFVRQLKELDAGTTLRIRINSGGGSAFEGLAIYHALRRYSGHKIVEIDALAASAASIIAMAGDEIIMPKSTFIMIHNGWTYMEGNSDELTHAAQMMAELDKSMANIYASRTGRDFAAIKQMMDDETWLSADTALELGFATSIIEDVAIAASLRGSNYLVNGVEFNNIPDNIKQIVTAAQASSNKNNVTSKKGNQPMDLQSLMQSHPELYKQIEAAAHKAGIQAGITAERERIKAIEEVAVPGHEALVIEAKYESGITAPDLAMKMMAAEKNARTQYRANNEADADPLKNISAGTSEPSDDGEIPANIMASFKTAFNKGR